MSEDFLRVICASLNIYEQPLKDLLAYCLLQKAAGHTLCEADKFLNQHKYNPPISSAELKKMAQEKRLVSSCDFDGLLVWDGNDIFINRYFKYETEIANAINNIIKTNHSIFSGDHFNHISFLRNILDEKQYEALISMISSRLFLISGGPGTGKTTTLACAIYAVFYLETVVKQTIAPFFVVASPTAKASAKIRQSFQSIVQNSKLPKLNLVYKPYFLTVHKLLKFGFKNILPGVDSEHPHICDWMIIDECSMVSLEDFYYILKGVAVKNSLILSGDKNQLPPIFEGAVFKDLLDFIQSKNGGFKYVFLSKNHRQQGPLSNILAYMDNYISSTQNLEGSTKPDYDQLAKQFSVLQNEYFHWQQNFEIKSLITELQNKAAMLKDKNSASEMLALIKEQILLCFNRHGPLGCNSINQQVMSNLNADNDAYFHGMPFIVKYNDYRNKLYNGDIGVFLRHDNKMLAAVESADGELVKFAADDIKEFKPAYAITVHESQGSEFNKVYFLIAELNSPLNQFQTLYTGLSRARQNLYMIGSSEAFIECLQRFKSRKTGLKKMLSRALLS